MANLKEKRQMQTAELYCLRIHPTGFGFGARTDTGEQVYLPQSVTVGARVTEGEVFKATLIVNTHPNNNSTPWVAIRVHRDKAPAVTPEAAAPAPVREPIDDRVLRHLEDLGFASTSEIAEEFVAEMDVHQTHNVLLRLFNAGRVIKADVFSRPGQERASFCLWAKDLSAFMGEEE
jgi:hypothetical protein